MSCLAKHAARVSRPRGTGSVGDSVGEGEGISISIGLVLVFEFVGVGFGVWGLRFRVYD